MQYSVDNSTVVVEPSSNFGPQHGDDPESAPWLGIPFRYRITLYISPFSPAGGRDISHSPLVLLAEPQAGFLAGNCSRTAVPSSTWVNAAPFLTTIYALPRISVKFSAPLLLPPSPPPRTSSGPLSF